MDMLRRWVLRHRPIALPLPGDLQLIEEPIPELQDGEVLVRTIYLSLDPTNRLWMSDRDQYMPPVDVGETMRGGTAGVVEKSRSDLLKVGDYVSGLNGWASHAVVDATRVKRVNIIPGLPLTASFSVLGGTGLTAWIGMSEIGRPQPGETVVVSAAAGAVGSVAAQIAKLKGARVIGIAGGPEKCDWLLNDVGLDGVVDYKNEDVGTALDRLCPNGIDVNFENVGGTIMDAVFARMNNFGRMAVCGLIASYNNEGPIAGPKDFGGVLMRRLTIRGFIVSDLLHLAPDAMAELVPWVTAGQIKWRVHVEQGLENAPQALERLFTGDHKGKLVVQVSPAP